MDRFEMNGINWGLQYVNPNNPVLTDRTGKHTLACTDPITKRIYMSDELSGELYFKVLLHELCHCALVSYGLLDYIHDFVKPNKWIEAEEFMCNLIADYGFEIQNIANKLSVVVPYSYILSDKIRNLTA